MNRHIPKHSHAYLVHGVTCIHTLHCYLCQATQPSLTLAMPSLPRSLGLYPHINTDSLSYRLLTRTRYPSSAYPAWVKRSPSLIAREEHRALDEKRYDLESARLCTRACSHLAPTMATAVSTEIQKLYNRSRMAVDGVQRSSSGLIIGNADKAAWRAAGSHSEAISFITTQDLDYLPGNYLKQGTTFAEVEDTRMVRISDCRARIRRR
jgi:hypothetical protein